MKAILVIDDDILILDTLHQLLSNMGYTVSVAENLMQARRICLEMNFDVALCDLYIEDEQFASENKVTSGMETIIKLSSEFPKLPIVAMSGGLPPNPDETLRRVGAVTTLAKPFTQYDLIEKIESARENKGFNWTYGRPSTT